MAMVRTMCSLHQHSLHLIPTQFSKWWQWLGSVTIYEVILPAEEQFMNQSGADEFGCKVRVQEEMQLGC